MKATSLSNLSDRELLVLLDGINALVSSLESDWEGDDLDGSRYDWDDIARMRERVLAAKRRVQ